MATGRKLGPAILLSVAMAATSAADAASGQPEQEILQQDVEIVLDEVGNGELTLEFALGALRWQTWKQSFGQYPHLIKRNIEHQQSALLLKDFALQTDDMRRTATFKVKGDAAAEYRGNGVFEVELEKGLRGTKLTESQWQFTQATSEDGALIQRTIRIRLPERARRAAEATNEFGMPVLRYEMPAARKLPLMTIAGGLLMILGGVVFAIGLRKRAPG